MALAQQTLPVGSAQYDPGELHDEAFSGPGVPRPHYAELLHALADADLDALSDDVSQLLRASGVAFGRGEEATPFVVDPVPRLLTATEWAELESGLGQRLRALNAFVADVYGERRALAEGVVPERVLAGVPFLEPDLAGAAVPGAAAIAIAGHDVIRDADGRFRVLEDNVRTPSGMAYALAARRAVDAFVPRAAPRRNLEPEVIGLLSGVLLAARAEPDGDGAVVLLSDGPSNSAWFEHRQLAALAGVALVLPEELRRDGDVLRLRASGRPVQALYRRTDCDRLRDDGGALTPMGELLLAPVLAGTLGLVNGFGVGVADDKLVYPYVDELVRFYLGEEPLVRSVATYDLAEGDRREEALGRLDELVVKPRDGHGGSGVLIGPRASAAELREAARLVHADPEGWVAQDTVYFSTHPTVVAGRLEPRHVDLRAFVLFDGEATHALPGGLTRVALEAGEMVVNSSRGGGGKDTWVLA